MLTVAWKGSQNKKPIYKVKNDSTEEIKNGIKKLYKIFPWDFSAWKHCNIRLHGYNLHNLISAQTTQTV